MEEKLSTQYNDAVQQIKTAILRSQAKALSGVNQEQLALYFSIGRFISQNSRAGFWGKDAVDTISRQLSAEMPGLRGFSPRNLRNMRTFYEQWQVLDTNSAVVTAKMDLMVVPINDVPVAAFFSIGFTHHIAILSGTKSLDERYYYIRLCYELGLTVEALQKKIAEDAFHNQGNMPNMCIRQSHADCLQEIQGCLLHCSGCFTP